MPANKKKKKPAKKSAKKAASKSAKVVAVPPGYGTITAGFATNTDGNKVIEFYGKAFGAKVKGKYTAPDGSIVHCELKMGDSVLMFGSPMGGAEYTMHGMMYFKNLDAAIAKAVAAGATVKKAAEDQFYGDRTATVVDPFGNEWWFGTHVENVAKKEMDRRMGLVMSGQPWR
ncbi:MAG TPA: VOC family protein [Myxococcota bacterium]|jgi:PhnB protein